MAAPVVSGVVAVMLQANANDFDPGRLECVVQHAAGGSDEGFALPILAVARLLAHEHHARVLGPFAEDRLGGVLVEVAGATAGGLLPQSVERQLVRGLRLASSGRLNVNSLPWPGVETTLMSPPCKRASSRAR